MIVMGIDPAMATGIVVMDGEEVLFAEAAKTKPKDGLMTRISSIKFVVMDCLHKYGVNEVAMETPYGGRNLQTYEKLAMLGGVLRYHLFQSVTHTTLVTPTQLKKFAGAVGSSKGAVAKAVEETYGFQHKSHDVMDAYVLARIAQARRKLSLAKTTAQKEVISAIKTLY
jgi:crossover junction endodeoxyribonuclease RuvC